MQKLIYSLLLIFCAVVFTTSDSFAKRGGGKSRGKSSSSHSSYSSKSYKKHKKIDFDIPPIPISIPKSTTSTPSTTNNNNKKYKNRDIDSELQQTQKIIHCKDKRKIITDGAWERDDNVVYIFGSSQRSIPRDQVERITTIPR